MVSIVAGFAGKVTVVERNPPLTLCHRNPLRGPNKFVRRRQLVVYSVVKEAVAGENTAQRLEDLPLPDGDYGLPFIGNVLKLQMDGGREFFLRYQKKYGNIYKVNFLGKKSIVIFGAENIQEVLVGESSQNIKCEMPPTLKKLFGPNSLANLPVDKHASIRKLLGPIFSPKAAVRYLPFIVERATQCCEKCVALGTFCWLEEMKQFTFITVTDAVFGVTFPGKSADEALRLLRIWMDGFFTFGIDLPFTKYRKAMRARRELLEMIQTASDLVDSEHKNDGMSKKALQLLIDAQDEEGKTLSQDEIGDLMLTLLFAGFETTAETLTHLVVELAHQPEVWDKLRAEQLQVIESFGEEITPETLDAMSYADVVIKEVMRFRILGSGVFRYAAKTFELGGYRIPEGWPLYVQTGLTTRYLDDRWMKDADEFKPERFHQEGATKSAYMPWGLGAHLCIGKTIAEQEIKVMLALLARKYIVVLQNPDVDLDQLTLARGEGISVPVRLEQLPKPVGV